MLDNSVSKREGGAKDQDINCYSRAPGEQASKLTFKGGNGNQANLRPVLKTGGEKNDDLMSETNDFEIL